MALFDMWRELNFTVSFNGLSLWWLALCLAAFLILTFLYYRATNPPVSRRRRIFLGCLRAAAGVLLFLSLARPALTLFYTIARRPSIVCLLDVSQSMSLSDNGQARSNQLKTIAGAIAEDATVNQDAIVKLYEFADRMNKITTHDLDSLHCNRPATNIGDNLETLYPLVDKENIRAVVVLSDGGVNHGRAPELSARTLGVPVYAVGIGDSSPVRDVYLRSVLTNEVAYKNNVLPVKVSFISNGFKGRRVTVQLRDNTRIYAQETVILGDDRQEQEVVFKLVPLEEGMQRFVVEIPPLVGERLTQNNAYPFFVQVMKDKIKVLLVTGYPGVDGAFLRRVLADDQNVDVTVLTSRNGGGFYQGVFPSNEQELTGYDLLVLQDVPNGQLPQTIYPLIIQAIHEKGKGLWVALGEYTQRYGGVAQTPLAALLPLEFKQQDRVMAGREYQLVLTTEGEQHPLMSLSQDPSESREFWKQVPPLVQLIKVSGVKPATTVLAVHPTEKYSPQEYCPVMAVGQSGRGKVFITAGSPFWRWRFLPAGTDPANAQRYRQFTGNVVRWLVTGDEARRFRVNTNKKIYKAGEVVEVRAALYNSQFAPINNAEIEVTVRDGERERKLKLPPAGEGGLYAASVTDLAAGACRIYGAAAVNNQVVGVDSGSFFIENYSQEFEDIRLRRDVLELMCRQSGGIYAPADNYQEVMDSLAALRPEKEKKQKQLDLWNNGYLLGLLVLLLGSEWFVRKRKGML